jgi:hypothetical protein
MAWVAWRHYRVTVAGLVLVLGVVSVYLVIIGDQARSFGGAAGHSLTLTAALFQVIPALIGAFVGAPVLARELETGTFRYTWTQGFGRARWTVATLAPLAIVVTVLAGTVGALFSWAYGPLIGGKYGASVLAGNTFDLHAVTFAAWTLAAFSIGVLAGLLIRRVVPAMVTTMTAWAALAVVTGVFLRPHYEAPLVSSNPHLPSSSWVMGTWWTQDGKTIGSSTINELLQKAGAQVSGGSVSLRPGSALGNLSPTQFLIQHGFTQVSSYQPASRFWSFQWIEAGWLLAFSLLVITLVVWLVHRRAA